MNNDFEEWYASTLEKELAEMKARNPELWAYVTERMEPPDQGANVVIVSGGEVVDPPGAASIADALRIHEITELKARIKALETPLKFYADNENWKNRDGDNPYPLVDIDHGQIARAALGGDA